MRRWSAWAWTRVWPFLDLMCVIWVPAASGWVVDDVTAAMFFGATAVPNCISVQHVFRKVQDGCTYGCRPSRKHRKSNIQHPLWAIGVSGEEATAFCTKVRANLINLPTVCIIKQNSLPWFHLVPCVRVRRRDNITASRRPYVRHLHWLPVRKRVLFKIAVLVYQCLNGLAPSYLADDCQLGSDVRPRRLRSSNSDSRFCAVRRIYPYHSIYNWNVPVPPTATGVSLSLAHECGTPCQPNWDNLTVLASSNGD